MKDAGSGSIEGFIRKHGIVNSFIKRPGFIDACFDHLCCRGVATGIAAMEIAIDVETCLLDFGIRDEVATGGVDVSEGEVLAAQVGEAVNGRTGWRNEERVELFIDGTLHEWHDTVARVGLDVSESTQVGEVEGSVAEGFYSGVVVSGDDQVNRFA